MLYENLLKELELLRNDDNYNFPLYRFSSITLPQFIRKRSIESNIIRLRIRTQIL